MNRKERRASRAGGGTAGPTAAASFANLFAAAVARHQVGDVVEAERLFRRIAALFPNDAETHGRLGAVLMAQGKINDAIAPMQRALALKPDLFEAHANLGQAYLATGQVTAAVEAAARALELKETPQGRAFFATCAHQVRLTADDGRVRRLLVRALAEGWARPRDLTGVSISVIKLSPAVKEAIARTNSAWPRRLAAADLFGTAGLAALAQDRLLQGLLVSDPVTDLALERLLTNVRHILLTDAATDAADASLLDFSCALARQCFINDYVFSTTAAEVEQAQRLRAALEAALASGTTCSPHLIAAVGAYSALHELVNAQALSAQSWPAPVDAVITQQIREPEEERRVAAAIPALTAIDGEVSRAVRQQYEESPYPRWAGAGTQWQASAPSAGHSDRALDALIAGCGTGLSTIELARQVPRARLLAIDLSRASLGYAKRRATSLGLGNIEFAQADLTRLGSLGRSFDFIDASGVLHHLADPWAGWRVLLSLLRPGGAMQVGLYSETARRNVVAARALIAARGYRPNAEDIRRCREAIAASDDPLLHSLTRSEDFFATNECRDLLFHVQEHRITLPEIKSFIAANGVRFAGFLLAAPIMRRFTERFPKPQALTDLDCWTAFEAEAPATFASMYQFWVRKPATS